MSLTIHRIEALDRLPVLAKSAHLAVAEIRRQFPRHKANLRPATSTDESTAAVDESWDYRLPERFQG